jgi:hypothetical protein
VELDNPSVIFLLVGLVVFYFLVVSIISVPSLLERWRRLKLRNRIESVFLPRATIAFDLIPKLRPFLPKQPTFYITAADGYSLTTIKRYPWAGFIREALAHGCEIHYILTDTSERDERLLLEKQVILQAGGKGTLYLYFAVAERSDEKDRELLESLRTFHIVLAETASERLFWTEHYHAPKSTVAYGCEFVAPADANGNPRYDEYKDAIVYLIKKYENRRRLSKAA